MATPRDFSSYPAEYAELFIKASSEEVRVEVASNHEAVRLRGRLYAFREALEHSAEKSPEAALLAPLVQLAIDNNILIASPIEPATSNLNEALHDESDPKIPAGNRQHDGDGSESLSGKVQK